MFLLKLFGFFFLNVHLFYVNREYTDISREFIINDAEAYYLYKYTHDAYT